VANRERQSLITVGPRPRLDVIYETLLWLVALGAVAWIIQGLMSAPAFSEGMGAGGDALIKGLIVLVVILVGGYLVAQTLLLNGRFGVLYGVVKGNVISLAAPEGLVGSRARRLVCDGAVTVAVRMDAKPRGSSSTPSTRIRLECGGARLVVQVSAPVGEPREILASIRAWLKSHGISATEVPYPSKGTAATS
jgi:hypothetical protein